MASQDALEMLFTLTECQQANHLRMITEVHQSQRCRCRFTALENNGRTEHAPVITTVSSTTVKSYCSSMIPIIVNKAKMAD